MVISALKNLSATENDAVLSEMLAAGDKYIFFHVFSCILFYIFIFI